MPRGTRQTFGETRGGVGKSDVRAEAQSRNISGRIQGLPKVLKYPLLSQERVKLRTSNFVRIHSTDRNKSP